MAGILNNKERMIDFIVTEEGKRQATAGQMKFEYATFTDMHTFYEPTGSIKDPGVAESAATRIYFEASNRYQDVIVPELEAGNSLRPFRTKDFQFDGKIVASGTFRKGFQKKGVILTGSQIVNVSERSLDGITQNFTDQRILGTQDPFAQKSGFNLSLTTGSFYFWDDMPMGKTPNGKLSLEVADSLYSDSRFSHFANFLYLPPVNKPTPGNQEGTPLGLYPRLASNDTVTLQSLRESLKDNQYVEIEFNETSRDNNLISQFFEFTAKGVEKLSIIDFGMFEDDNPYSPGKHIFFVGKLFQDANGSETFLNIFTVEFD